MATIRRLLFPLSVRHLSGPASPAAGTRDMIVVCLVRNGQAHLPGFLQHYRELGARHMVFLDNGSTDATCAMLRNEPDVTVFRTTAAYRSYKDAMKGWLVRRFGRHNWVLCVDIDELFDFPARAAIGIHGLLDYLNRNGYTAVIAQLLDMFPAGALAESAHAGWREAHRFYDISKIERVRYADFYGDMNRAPDAPVDVFHGGIRSSAFEVRALLTKHPLLFPSRGVRNWHAHHVSGARPADFSAVLLHYKYVGDFSSYVDQVVKEGSFSLGSREYRNYQKRLRGEPALQLRTTHAEELTSVEQLVERKFLVVSENFRRATTGVER